MSLRRAVGSEPPPLYTLLPPSTSPTTQGNVSRPQSLHSPLAHTDTARLAPQPPLLLSRSQLPERNAPLPTPPRPPGRIRPRSTASPTARQSRVVEETPVVFPGPPPAPSSSRPSMFSLLFGKRRPTAADEARLAAEREAAAEEARRRAAEERARMLAQKEKAKVETRKRVLDALRALLSLDNSSDDEWMAQLRSCAEACESNEVDFAALLQEPVILDRLPVFWAIVKRSGMQEETAATVMEARNACVTVSDNALFQRFCKRFKEFTRTTDTDLMLLGGSEVEDKIVVEEVRGDSRAFVVHFELARFRLRMRVAKQVCAEFVARDRMWNITFSATTEIFRPPAPVDAQLVITDNSSGPGEPDISIPFKAEERMLGHEKSECISIVLGRSTTGTGPQDGFASYVDALGVFKARFEARLAISAPA
ncbi:hypothetical protein BC826DRAFT_1107067 [Russula brevipes]|nr:hypothetical protein BC826DRAFT_1107067 [Russula brevipes]